LKCIEYEFILPNGERRYEFVDPDRYRSVMMQVELFMHMHGAIIARPLEPQDPA
jgi:hypothetical protein